MKKRILMIITAALLGSFLISGCSSAEKKIYEKYSGIVSGLDEKKWDGFALIDLDGDGVKELFATCINGEREDQSIQPYMIVGHNDKDTVISDELQDGIAGAGGYRGELYYLEGKGILHESMTFAPLGLPADTVYVLKNGSIEISDTGEFSVESFDDAEDEGWDPLKHGYWSWNGERVDEDRYREMLREATKDTDGLPMSGIEWQDKDAILEEIKRNQ